MSNNNIMRRKFSLREIIMLVVLVVVLFVGLWFMLVYYPVRNRINDIQQQKEELALQNDVASMRLATYNRMQAALDEIHKMDDAEQTKMHNFGTEEQTAILDDFHEILAETKGLDITIYTPTQRDSNVVACRYNLNFTVTFEPTAYETLKGILEELMTRDKRRCLMGELRLNPVGEDLEKATDIRVSVDITFYELGKVA